MESALLRLRDARGRRVVFLSHCLLNENTRYPGGACRAACVREIAERCMAQDQGMVQMRCPEEHAWGGVTKRWLLRLYGGSVPSRLVRAFLPLELAWTRFRFRRLARGVARQVEDYLRSGFAVDAIVLVDGSPSCGLNRTVDMRGFVRELARVDPAALTVDAHNALVRRHVVPGRGSFAAALERELRRRHLAVPLLAHDLIAELELARERSGRAPVSPTEARP